jgi:hypothetical protein
MSAFTVVPLPGLTMVFSTASQFNEVREAVKFLGVVATNTIGGLDPQTFYTDLVQRYTPESSLAYTLTMFRNAHLAAFEAAVRSSLANVDDSMLTAAHDDPILLQIKDWLVHCACAPEVDPSGVLGAKLSVYVEPQPELAALAPPLPLPAQVRERHVPEMARALTELMARASEPVGENGRGSFYVVREDAYHILREFMRLAMNCAAVWRKYGPTAWNFAHSMPELSDAGAFAGHMAVCDAWRRMLLNPYSDAPLHVRRILARCDVVAAASYFLTDLQRALSHPYPALLLPC